MIEYTASIVSTNDMKHPFAVVVASDGEEVARKRVRTVEEAELFLELLYAALELNVLQAQGGHLH
jgi:hypothetical protein